MEPTADELEARRVAQVEAAMTAQGVPTHEKVQEDYFAFDETHVVYFPDGVSYVQHATFNEGARRKYLNAINRDVRLQKTTGDAVIKTAPGDERAALLEAALTGWNLVKQGKPIPFQPTTVKEFLNSANPRIIDDIEKDIRLKNPWLMGELTADQIEEEIKNLTELLEKKREEEAGKDGSSSA